MNKKFVIIIGMHLLASLLCFSDAQTKLKNHINDTWAIPLVDYFIRHHPDTAAYSDIPKSRNWNYEQGLVLQSIYTVYLQRKDTTYLNYIKKNIDYYVQPDGSIRTYKQTDYNLDNIAPGVVLLNLFKETGDIKYKKASDLLREQLKNQPRTKEGGFWHKKIYPYQMWLDGLFMAEPFYLNYSLLEKDTASLTDIANQFIYISNHAKDSPTGLYYHGWDESKQQKWADPVKGTSPNFWGRAMGWYLMALTDVLEKFPAEHASRPALLKIYNDLAASLLKYQDPKTKLWYQVTDKMNEKGNYIEASASLMYIYSYLKGSRLNLLPSKFSLTGAEAFASVISKLTTVNENGNIELNNTCSVAGLGGKPYRDGSYTYYINEPIRVNDFKGYGPFILAASEMNLRKR